MDGVMQYQVLTLIPRQLQPLQRDSGDEKGQALTGVGYGVPASQARHSRGGRN